MPDICAQWVFQNVGFAPGQLGWIALCGNAALVDRAAQGLEVLLDFYLSVGTPIQHAAAWLLTLRPAIQEMIHTRLADNARFLSEQVARIQGCHLLSRQGGWYAILAFFDTLGDEERVIRYLSVKDTLVHPGYFYDFSREGFIVVSLLPSTELFQAGINRILDIYE